MVILITGKAGAGKTHYSKELAKELIDDGERVIVLDGDELRDQTGNKDFTREGRMKNLKKAAELAADFEKDGFIVICAFIAPFKEFRDMMRKLWAQSRVVYVPGGTLWEGSEYEVPRFLELETR